VALGTGKSRVNLTLPEKLLADLQQEAERSHRSVSDVVATTIEEAWQSDETKLTSLQQQLTQLAVVFLYRADNSAGRVRSRPWTSSGRS
jgi:metal-responsive CopG/Arc/MetJ family transcriptional regulator